MAQFGALIRTFTLLLLVALIALGAAQQPQQQQQPKPLTQPQQQPKPLTQPQQQPKPLTQPQQPPQQQTQAQPQTPPKPQSQPQSQQNTKQTRDPKCLLPKEPGPCRMSLDRFYYNSQTNACEPFKFGGCRGNDNKFGFLKTCEDACLVGAGKTAASGAAKSAAAVAPAPAAAAATTTKAPVRGSVVNAQNKVKNS